MIALASVDGALVTWGNRLFYPGNKMVRDAETVRLRAAALRCRIEAAVVRHAPQVMVRVMGGGRGMSAISAHFRYISGNGRLELEDQRGETVRGQDSLRDLAQEWQLGGSWIPSATVPGHHREAFNLVLSMPRGTDAASVQRAAREFAKVEFAGHKYVLILHEHQANPHVHLCVRAESNQGRRLCPAKQDLHRWRDTFAQKLREYGVDAEATRQATRGQRQCGEPLWQRRARKSGALTAQWAGRAQAKQATHVMQATEEAGLQPGRSRFDPSASVQGQAADTARAEAAEAWLRIGQALAVSPSLADRALARAIEGFYERFDGGRPARARGPLGMERTRALDRDVGHQR